MNYVIFCLHTNRFLTGLKTLGDCLNELRHAGGFGIYNAAIDRTVCVRTISGFRFTSSTENRIPKSTNMFVRKRHTWY